METDQTNWAKRILTKDAAKAAYRKAWTKWCLATGWRPGVPVKGLVRTEAALEAEAEMDRVQPFITPGPGPEWTAFISTLPGYLEWWSRIPEHFQL